MPLLLLNLVISAFSWVSSSSLLNVDVPTGRGMVVLVPDKLGGVQKASNSKLDSCSSVIAVPSHDNFTEVPDGLHDRVLVPPLGQVVQSCDQEHSHWARLVMVVNPPGKFQTGYCGPWNSQPVDMANVRRTHNTLVPGLMEVVKLRAADTDVQPIVQPSRVGVLAGGAHVRHVGELVLHSLQDSDLPC